MFIRSVRRFKLARNNRRKDHPIPLFGKRRISVYGSPFFLSKGIHHGVGPQNEWILERPSFTLAHGDGRRLHTLQEYRPSDTPVRPSEALRSI